MYVLNLEFYSMIYAHRLRFVEILGHRAVNVQDVRNALKRVKVVTE